MNVPSQNMNEQEKEAWKSYLGRRKQEIHALKPDAAERTVENQIWFEFLQYKWALICGPAIEGMDPIEYGRKLQLFGPDIRSIRNALFSKPQARHTRAKQQKDSAASRKKKFISVYEYYVHKKMNEFKQQSIKVPAQKRISEISAFWKAMPQEEKDRLNKEMDQYLQSADYAPGSEQH